MKTPPCTRCKRRPAKYYRWSSGEKLCTACLYSSLLRAYRHTLRNRIDLSSIESIAIILDDCSPATSAMLIKLTLHQMKRALHLLHGKSAYIIAYSGKCAPLVKYGLHAINQLSRDMSSKSTDLLEIRDCPVEHGVVSSPLIRGSERLECVLSRLLDIPVEKPVLALLPYAAEQLTQWYLGGIHKSPLWLARLEALLEKSRIYPVAPLQGHSIADYTALAYLVERELLEALSECKHCALLDTRLLSLQWRSPEYSFAPLKLLDELKKARNANSSEA